MMMAARPFCGTLKGFGGHRCTDGVMLDRLTFLVFLAFLAAVFWFEWVMYAATR
jgi:hypothetical protein